MRTLLAALIFLVPLTAFSAGDYSSFPAYGDKHWKAPVATVGALPSSGNFPGDTRLVLSPLSAYSWSSGTWLAIVPASIVTGPASATDNAIARFDGTTGAIIQNSSCTVSDAGLLTVANLITSGLTATTVPYLNGSKQLSSSAVTPTELGYLSGVTGGIQSALDGKEATVTAPGNTTTYYRGDKSFQTLNTSIVPEGSNLYYTEGRVSANTDVAANTAARHSAVTIGTANGLSLVGQAVSMTAASSGVTGALTGTDWDTFNGKQASGNYITALTGGVTASGPGSVAATVVSVGGAAAADIATATSAANAATNANTNGAIVKRDGSGNFSAGTITAALTGNVSGNLTGNVTGNVSGTAASITGVNAIAQGGTNNGSLSVTAGSVYYGDGSKLVALAPGTSGQYLQSNASSAPSWSMPFQTLFFSTGENTVADGVTRYFGNGQFSTQAIDVNQVVPYDATIDRLYAYISQGSGGSRTYTLMVNGSASALAAGITTPGAATDVQGSDTSNSVNVSAGDRICIRISTGGGVTPSTYHQVSVRMRPR